MTNDILIKNFIADGAIGARLIVKPGSADGKVSQASAATDKLIGVTTILGAADTQRIDVVTVGIVDVIAGGTITRGDLLTSDANGKAVTAAPAAGSNARIIGVALESAVSGDFVSCLLSQSSMQG